MFYGMYNLQLCYHATLLIACGNRVLKKVIELNTPVFFSFWLNFLFKIKFFLISGIHKQCISLVGINKLCINNPTNIVRDCAFVCALKMILTSAEKRRRYQVRRKNNPGNAAEAKREDRERYHANKRLVRDLTNLNIE